jgi:hypothetical protein
VCRINPAWTFKLPAINTISLPHFLMGKISSSMIRATFPPPLGCFPPFKLLYDNKQFLFLHPSEALEITWSLQHHMSETFGY